MAESRERESMLSVLLVNLGRFLTSAYYRNEKPGIGCRQRNFTCKVSRLMGKERRKGKAPPGRGMPHGKRGEETLGL